MNRKTILIIGLQFLCTLLIAQKEYNFMISGSLGYRYSTDKSDITAAPSIEKQEHLIQANPSIGYFITNRIAIGIGIEYQYDYIKYDKYLYTKSIGNEFAISPFVRYYTGFGLFAVAEFGYGSSIINLIGDPIPTQTGFIGGPIKLNYRIIGYSAGIGYSVRLNSNLRIEPMIKYINIKYNEDSENDKDYKSKGLLLNIGFAYYF